MKRNILCALPEYVMILNSLQCSRYAASRRRVVERENLEAEQRQIGKGIYKKMELTSTLDWLDGGKFFGGCVVERETRRAEMDEVYKATGAMK